MFAAAGPALAHNGVAHRNGEEAAAHRAGESPKLQAAAAAPSVTPGALFPKGLGGAYDLVDQFGGERDERDPDGRPQLVFFGYPACDAICAVAMPRVAAAVRLLEEKEGILATPVLINVDPEGGPPAAIRAAMDQLHPRYLALTGSAEALAAAQKAFQVESKEVARTPANEPIFAHGSFIYLMDAEGVFLTLMPPILSPERIAEIVKGYLAKGGAG